MKRFQRPAAVALTAALASAGLAVVGVTPASAATLGTINVTPLTGTDETGFSGSVSALCPAGTAESYFSIDGADLPADQAILAPGNASGQGNFSFSGASIANVKGANAGSFASSGPYYIRFNCVRGSDGVVSDQYVTQMNYTAGGGGAYSIVVPARATATTLTSSAGTAFAEGTTTNLVADVTPTSGADNPSGAVQFFDGSTSLGTVNTLTATGGATLSNVALLQGSHSITAVYSPANSSFTGSTSPAVVITVAAAPARTTSSALTVSPSTGPAYTATTLTCTVTASTGGANGTVTFLDGSATLGTAAITGGSPAVFTSSAFAPGTHPFSCSFAGTAPYTNSTSPMVTATYDAAAGAPSDPDPQTVTVEIPAGTLAITTPYTPANPLALGTALLDQATSTFSTSKPFNKVTITDTRVGQFGFRAFLQAGAFTNGAGGSFGGDRAGFTSVTAVQVVGNAMQKTDVTTASFPAVSPGIGSTRQFASYPSGKSLGSVDITANFDVAGIPTSITPGTYTSTVTFTAV